MNLHRPIRPIPDGSKPVCRAFSDGQRNQKRQELKKLTLSLSRNAVRSRLKDALYAATPSAGAFRRRQPYPEIEGVEGQPGKFTFVTYGWGHGVGMSQNGANFYANFAGWSYRDILAHYYPGTYIENTGLIDYTEYADQPKPPEPTEPPTEAPTEPPTEPPEPPTE